MEISDHSFPVLAVDKLGYQAAFARQQTRIVEGRDLTEEERTNGSKVCIISQEVSIPLEADMCVITPVVAIAQLLVAATVIFIVSLFATGRKNMMKRK